MKSLAFILLFLIPLKIFASLLVDNAESGTTINTRGGAWIKYNDSCSGTSFTPNVSPGYAGIYCRLFEWTFNTGGSSMYAGSTTGLNSGWTGENVSSYRGVRFYAKGTGRYEISLATDQTRSENNHYVKAINVTPEWKLYELPFSQFAQTWGTPKPWDPTTVYAIGFNAVGWFGMTGQLWIDDIEFYLESEAYPPLDPNIVIPNPKVNQLGYFPDATKYFCVASDLVSAGDTFHLIDLSHNVVFAGAISGTPINDTASTGEYVWKVDFSEFTTPGSYSIELQKKKSYPFQIKEKVYNDLFKDALRCFYLIRCGLAENDPVTGITRPACHAHDARIRGGAGSIDVAGGWHNACDKGKYVHEASISIAHMLWLYELKGNSLADLGINIPESGNGVSDLLDEARWGLEWLLKMQKPDGTVYHKVDSEPNLYYCPEQPPDQDPYDAVRYVEFQKCDEPQEPSTVDAADFAGVMSQASRVFKGIDSAFAGECLGAAQKAWTWVSANPNVGQTDPYYRDSVSWQEYLWAKGEMARTLNSNILRAEFNANIDTASLTYIMWGTPQLFGYLALYYDGNTGAGLKSTISDRIVSLCNSIVAMSQSSGYGVALRFWEYWWESNSDVINKGNCLLYGYEMTHNAAYLDAALGQLNYILGLNSLDKSFVMSYGSNAMEHPYHWIYNAYGAPLPGWMAGGANSYGGDVILDDIVHAGTPRAKCYTDISECGLGAWACNEGEICLNSALVFMTGYFYRGNTNTAVKTSESSAPVKCRLFQNYPNPFNPITVISYDLPAGQAGLPVMSKVSLKIYDLLGREVATIVDEEKPAGRHECEFDAGGLSSGVYFYRLQVGHDVVTKKLLLLR
jgi:endoglucanase